MDNQNGTVDRMVEQLTESDRPAVTEIGRSGDACRIAAVRTARRRRRVCLGQPGTSEETQTASLVGSLSVFSLSRRSFDACFNRPDR